MTNLITRDDTLLGICEGIGDEFGVAPNALRIALGAMLFVAPWATIGLYLACGVVLATARLIWPVVRPPVSGVAAAPSAANDPGDAVEPRAAA